MHFSFPRKWNLFLVGSQHDLGHCTPELSPLSCAESASVHVLEKVLCKPVSKAHPSTSSILRTLFKTCYLSSSTSTWAWAGYLLAGGGTGLCQCKENSAGAGRTLHDFKRVEAIKEPHLFLLAITLCLCFSGVSYSKGLFSAGICLSALMPCV